ncbi:MAG: phenylalanine--tRNA ligase subunit alpha [Chloroflexota bacterium]
MQGKLDELKRNALEALGKTDSLKELESWRVRYLGRRSDLTMMLRGLSSLPLEERKTAGALANSVKIALEESFKQREERLASETVRAQLTGTGKIDITLPGRRPPLGRLHPVTQTINEMCDIFVSLGFQVVEGPEVEWEYYNFEALNIPREHPARDNMSTFWIDFEKDGERSMLLRTHTSPMQVRFMEKVKPPLRIVVPGKVWRYEAINATHIPMFQQIEGLAVDVGVSMADLKGILYEFVRRFFGADRKARFRCDYFPFVEPGVELAIDCAVCHGSGCSLCKDSGWIEIGGAGMVHPEVLKRVGIDPEVHTGFAFGLGIERIPMLRYGIDDVRLFYANDLRFLRQF